MSQFSIAGLQLEVSARDNRFLVQKEIETLMRRFPWVDMVVLGELATFGPDTARAEPLPGPAEQFYCEIAQELGIWLLPGSLMEKADDDLYNTASVINPEGKVVARHRKLFPWCPGESHVRPGEDITVFDVPGVGCFGVCICYDQWFPEVARNLAWAGAEVILCPTLTGTVDRELELTLARANAITNQCYFFNINVAASLGNGQSIVVDPNGQVLHQAGERLEAIPIEVDLELVRRVRERGSLAMCQTLKSFRDSTVAFPAYDLAARRSEALNQLGELKVPAKPGGIS